jgi:hypothetical protein
MDACDEMEKWVMKTERWKRDGRSQRLEQVNSWEADETEGAVVVALAWTYN